MDNTLLLLLLAIGLVVVAAVLTRASSSEWCIVTTTIELECSACHYRITVHNQPLTRAAPTRCPVCNRKAKLRGLSTMIDINA